MIPNAAARAADNRWNSPTACPPALCKGICCSTAGRRDQSHSAVLPQESIGNVCNCRQILFNHLSVIHQYRHYSHQVFVLIDCRSPRERVDYHLPPDLLA